MKATFGCGHPYTAENTSYIGLSRTACRTCRLEQKRRWRERSKEIAEAKLRPKPVFTPVALPPELRPPEQLTPEAIGSRNLLIAYAKYYEKHVRREAA
jgi:hypothetical protein